MQTWIVVNPAAGSGRATKAGTELARLLPNAQLRQTASPGDGTSIAREAVDRGVELVVAVGGDGTIQELVTGLCLDHEENVRRPTTRLGFLPAGTGGDYRRSLGIPASAHETATRLQSPELRAVDVGIVEYAGSAGAVRREAFLNVLSFGLGGLTNRLVKNSPPWIGGPSSYLLGAFRANLVYRPVPLELFVDGRPLPLAPYSNVAVCLGRYFGGGMNIAPEAELDDGLFDIVTIEGTRLGIASLTLDIYRGTHLKRSCTSLVRGRVLTARPTVNAEVLLDLDGNQPGRLPVKVELLPRALSLAL